jgi:hypothetical protein
MSNTTFVIINKGIAKYVVAHYSCIKELLQGKDKPENYSPMSLYVNDGVMQEYSDTKFMPSVIIDFDTKTLTTTDYNWFDDFEKYLNKDWKHQKFSRC